MPPRQRAAAAPQAGPPFTEKVTGVVNWMGPKLVVPVLVLLLAAGALPFIGTEEQHIDRVLSTPHAIAPPSVHVFQNRSEIGSIMEALELGRDFLVVEGGNRMGKSTAVAMAVSSLSVSRPVLREDGLASDTLDSFLRRLLGISEPGIWGQVVSHLPLSARCPDVVKTLKRRAPTLPQPVLVVELAEKLPVATLSELLELSKELADAQRGLFVFVFSPSDKLEAVGGLGALTRATIITVGDLPKDTTLGYLSSSYNCSPEQAEAVYQLLGGHLSDLVNNIPLRAFCSGQITETAFSDQMLLRTKKTAMAVDESLHCDPLECSCPALCCIIHPRYKNDTYIKAKSKLIYRHLARASLADTLLVVDSPLVLKFIEQQCHCSGGS